MSSSDLEVLHSHLRGEIVESRCFHAVLLKLSEHLDGHCFSQGHSDMAVDGCTPAVASL